MGKFKEQTIDESPSENELPRELRAVITVLAADPELVRKALPHVDIDLREIKWDEIFQNDLSGGHSAALLWAKSMWTNQLPQSDPFDKAFAMDAKLQQAVLRGLAIRWGLVA